MGRNLAAPSLSYIYLPKGPRRDNFLKVEGNSLALGTDPRHLHNCEKSGRFSMAKARSILGVALLGLCGCAETPPPAPPPAPALSATPKPTAPPLAEETHFSDLLRL